MKRLFALLLAVLMLLALFTGCQEAPEPTGTKPPDTAADTDTDTPAPPPETQAPEVSPAAELAVPVPDGVAASQDNNRVFYEIFVGSFSDSNGDGVGDLRGVINRMDYLNDGDETSGKSLGVEGIWLTPIFLSDSYHKYDINDFYTIDERFGTMEDLRELIALCHQRNVKLILDLPINHTSRSNVWFYRFTEAHRNEDPDDDYYDFYSYYTKGEDAPAGRTFSPLSGTNVYYECNFDGGMPELNYDCEAVRQAVLDVAAFYLELGVDGFRFDAAKYLYYGDHKSSVDFWLWYLEELRAIKPDLYTVAEVWDADTVTQVYYPAVNCFNFTVSQAEGVIAKTAKGGSVARYTAYVEEYLNSIAGTNPDAMYVPFIANHDTDRAAGYLSPRTGAAQMAANVLLLGPGSPFLYYGEELGMKGSRGGANTDANRRLAMVWGDGDTVRDPVGTTYAADNRADATAAQQIAQEDSLYNHYKKVILLRKANPEIARGTFTGVKLSDGAAGGFVAEWNGSKVLVVHNPAQEAVTLDLAALGLAEFTAISGFVGLGSASLNGAVLTLEGQTSVVLR